ncbi:anaerobic ribonucleoside-triphosphate reductase [Methanococcoides sp.]|uniref:anaerobic ribonucleoside-triphosphate reductase n=1 Tax=Methanococcoides sp. TaxID=1966350 RepID=UPI00272ED08B|nr:anaerobic ribonucleoside-triphosphate reductase [Methanococcoides sp.]
MTDIRSVENMSEREMMSVDKLYAMPLSRFVERCVAWCDEFNDGKEMKIEGNDVCPVQLWVMANGSNCPGETVVDLIATCKVCGDPVCPDCMNHNVHQLSRVTGYLSNVSGWNEAKKQELKDRNRNF